MSRFLGTWIYQ